MIFQHPHSVQADPKTSRFVHRRKLHMAVTREVSDFRLDELARCHCRPAPEQRNAQPQVDSSEMVFSF
jgi:hypothetical protein